ncbi:hypothetical protein ACOSQ2_007322 [Xanthoceras sorbifolium]
MLSQAIRGKSYKKKQLDNALGKHPNVKYNLYDFQLKPSKIEDNDVVISPNILIRDTCVDPGQHIHCIEDCPSIRPSSRQDTAASESTHPPCNTPRPDPTSLTHLEKKLMDVDA